MFTNLMPNTLKQRFSPDLSGSIAGQLRVKSAGSENQPFIDTLSNVTIDNLEWHLNLRLHKPDSRICYSVREALVFILQRKNKAGQSLIGQDVGNNRLSDESRNEFGKGNGIRKPSIALAKEVLYFNGLMTARRYHFHSVQYCWIDPNLMEASYRAVKNGMVIKAFGETAPRANTMQNQSTLHMEATG